jgi:hypothetical protein
MIPIYKSTLGFWVALINLIMAASPSKASAPVAPRPPEASMCSSLWSDLPVDLAGLVLRRLPSLADRVCFGSVCRHWRHAARQQAPVLPPALPWTITSSTGKAQSIPDGEVHRLCPGKLAQCACSSESWLLMIGKASRHDTTESLNFLKNPLSGAIVLLPDPGSLLRHGAGLYCVTKFIVCRSDLVVATTTDNIPSYKDPLIACSPGTSPSWSMSTQGAATDGSSYQDIAFHDGSIYAMAEQGDLYVHRVSEDDGLGVVLSSAKLVIKGSAGDTRWLGVSRFLVVSRSGRLLMVKWNHRHGNIYHDDGISAFEVFEADLQMSRWSRLSSIGDQVLFVSQRCSKAVPVSHDHCDDYLCGDRVYFVDNAIYGPKECCFGATSCGMYDLRNNTCHPVVSDAFRDNNIAAAAWFFPHT